MRRRVAVYDACVLFPAPLRSLLMYVALEGLVRARWTDTIHEEWMRGVVETYPDIVRAKVERVRALMNAAIPDAIVTGFESLIESLELPDPDDRHVLAAAIFAEAEVIVTFNLKDFPKTTIAPLGIRAVHPDEFLLERLELAPKAFCTAVRRQRESLRNPPLTAEELLSVFEKQGLAKTVAKLRTTIDKL